MDDEILDIVDGHDNVIGTVNRKDYKQFLQDNVGFIRAAELFIMNARCKLWIPTRTAHVTIAPNGLDYSAAGHVGSGEDYLTAIIREANEEINLSVTASELEFIAKLKSPSTKYLRSIYLLRSNVTPTFSPDEFAQAEWLSPDEVIACIDSGVAAKSSLRPSIVTLQAYLADAS